MSGKFYVTTPIYYVNDRPHIGHAYTTILADVLACFHRSMGDDTYFLTGTDEHGQKVENAAAKNGVTPQQHADETVVRFQELWQKLGITNDDFIRTTEARHKDVVKEILQDLYDRGEIYKAEYTSSRIFTTGARSTRPNTPAGTAWVANATSPKKILWKASVPTAAERSLLSRSPTTSSACPNIRSGSSTTSRAILNSSSPPSVPMRRWDF